jgi:hypothetical protein
MLSSPLDRPAARLVYPLVPIDGQNAPQLEDLIGDARFMIDAGDPYVVHGSGTRQGDTVTFYEKYDAGKGRDVLVWRILRTATGALTAEHVAGW